MEENIKRNLVIIHNRINNACKKSNRNPDEVKLLLATKTVSAERIKVALQAGQTLIAENKVQELKEKYEELKHFPHTNHFIGHLQTNKLKEILKHDVTCIHSLDRLELAKKLNHSLKFKTRV